MQVAEDPILQSFYSSVVNEVIEGIKREEVGIDANTAELIKNLWMLEYTRKTAKSLDLHQENTNDSEVTNAATVDSVFYVLFGYYA